MPAPAAPTQPHRRAPLPSRGARAALGLVLYCMPGNRLREPSDLPRITEPGIGPRTSQSTAGALYQSALPSPLGRPRAPQHPGHPGRSGCRATSSRSRQGHSFPPSGGEVAMIRPLVCKPYVLSVKSEQEIVFNRNSLYNFQI